MNKDFKKEEKEVDLPTLEDTEERREYSSDEPAFLKSIDDHTKTLKLDAVEVTMQPEKKNETIEEEDEDKGYLVKRVVVLVILALILVGLGLFAVLSNRQDEEHLAEQRQQQIAEETPTPEPTPTPTPSASPTATPVPSSTPTPEAATPEPAPQYGTAVINAELIKRDQPSVNGVAVGSAYAGESYQVVNIQEGEGYTWYQLSDNTWVASEGTWITYQE